MKKRGSSDSVITPTLRNLLDSLGLLRDLDPEMSLSTAMSFLHVAVNADFGITATELSSTLNLANSGPRRHMDLLSKRGRGGKIGLNLVVEEIDDMDRRSKRFLPSVRGRRLASAMVDKLRQ